MSIELVHVDDQSCTLIERAMGSKITSEVTLQASKSKIVETMKTLLSDADKQDTEDGNVRAARRRDELWLTVGIANVPLKWTNVFPIVLEA